MESTPEYSTCFSNFTAQSTLIDQCLQQLESRLFGELVDIHGIYLDIDEEWISENLRSNLRNAIYEISEEEIIRTYLRPDLPTIDLGAGLGYTSCLVCENTNGGVPVLAVEADPYLVNSLLTTRALNRCSYHVVGAAYHSSGEAIELTRAEDFWSSSVGLKTNVGEHTNVRERITVESVTLQSLVDRYSLGSPFQLIVDVEGSEFDLLSNELSLLRQHCGLLLIEFHAKTEHSVEEYRGKLEQADFEFVDEKRSVSVYANTRF